MARRRGFLSCRRQVDAVGLVTLALAALAGCSGSATTPPDGDEAGDLVGDVAVEVPGAEGAESPVDSAADGADAVPLPDVPSCGDDVLDDGEECDDGNRLDGDGCDWLCRLGDGDPPPDPTPGVEPFEPSGEGGENPVDGPTMPDIERFPFVWTGSVFATAVREILPDDSGQIRFRRFDTSGGVLDADVLYPVAQPAGAAPDLVWNGNGFGLFWASGGEGILFRRLDLDGKPLGGPVLIVPDGQARSPAADLTPDGYVVSWIVEGLEAPGMGWSWCGSWGDPPDAIRVRLVGPNGERDGFSGPVTIEERAGYPPDVATGPEGFGVVFSENSAPDVPGCRLRFVRLSPDLAERTDSGGLSFAGLGQVLFAEDRYFATWSVNDGTLADHPWCVGRFRTDGRLERSPVCTSLGATDGGGAVRVAAGAGGLALVGLRLGDRTEVPPVIGVTFQRTDLFGAAVGPAILVDPDRAFMTGPCAVAWADGPFGVLYTGWSADVLRLRLLRAAD